LALVAFSVIPATLAVLLLFVRNLRPMFRSFQKRLGALNAVLQENIAGARVVRGFSREGYEVARYRVADEALLEQGLQVRRTVANAFPLLFGVGTLGVGVVTVVGAAMIVRGALTVGELVAFTSYLFLLLQPLFIIGFGAQTIARAGASAERLFEVLDAPIEVAEREDALALTEMSGRIDFAGVSLRYPGDTRETLSGVTFSVEAGTITAIVGATGSGKTSLVNLVPRFYDVSDGAVLVDGHDVRDLTLSSLRSRVGIVMQDSVLFSGSVRENIAFGRPDATLDEIEAAARVAQAHEFISRLPEGYDTRVGERGVKLSGGERQRVAIARALLIDPRILIMDDATSSVDATTDAALRRNLAMLMEERTTLIVAQRLSTVRRADQIVVLDNGSVVDLGTHEDLLARSCVYAEIAASQLAGGDAVVTLASCPLDGGSR
ncbi:MAG TPA: ABC transporter ATP-binding protein, partial [Coriobacteriia bacterium]|nr:ABC transporter ATP-binding protein [Coriobacteriia bacterium]